MVALINKSVTYLLRVGIFAYIYDTDESLLGKLFAFVTVVSRLSMVCCAIHYCSIQ